MSGRVIAAFPATGKTYYAVRVDRHAADSDSSRFSWSTPGVRHPEWPGNYIEHVRDLYESGRTVLVSTHAEVRQALLDADISFTLVYPDDKLREEYRQRMLDRGSPEGLIEKVIDDLWDGALLECRNTPAEGHLVLKSGQHLSDVIE